MEIANINAGLVHVAEKMAGWQKRLCEYPTFSQASGSDTREATETATPKNFIVHRFCRDRHETDASSISTSAKQELRGILSEGRI